MSVIGIPGLGLPRQETETMTIKERVHRKWCHPTYGISRSKIVAMRALKGGRGSIAHAFFLAMDIF